MKLQFLIVWHKSLGMFATVLIIMLSLTGILLLHTDDLKLQDKFIENEILLSWYQLEPDDQILSFMTTRTWVSQLSGHVYLDDRELFENPETLRGAVNLGDMLVLAFDNSLFVMTPQGDLIERITGLQGLPHDITAAGIGESGRLHIKSAQKNYSADIELTDWQDSVVEPVLWSGREELPEHIKDNILKLYRGHGLSFEKVILDIHSGRFWGRYGIWIVDLSVIIFLGLALTGWWAWFKRRALQKEIESRL